MFPYVQLPAAWLYGAVGLCFFTLSMTYDRSVLCGACVLSLAFMMGLLRFSLAQPTFPRGLIFADPKGLLMSAETSRTANHLDPRHWLSRARTALTVDAYERFPRDEAALLTGLLYGAHDLSKGDKLAFRHAGLTHIIAVSGANMTIIVVLVMRILLMVHLSRRQAFMITVFAIILFTLFVGPSASVVRAACMGVFIEMAPLVGRLVRLGRILLVSAVLFVFWRPLSLVFDPSFALSFFAVTGLLTWGRWLDDRLIRLVASRALREIVTSTLSATVMTAPYAAWAFGNTTMWGLLTGLVVLPMIPWAMAFGSLSMVSPLWIVPTSGLLSAMLWMARLPDRVRLGFLDRAYLSFFWVCVSYGVLFVCWRVARSHEGVRKKISTAPHGATRVV